MERYLDKTRYYAKIVTIPLEPINILLVLVFAIWGKYPAWMITPDDPVSPFGKSEPTVTRIYQKFGRYVGDVYWLAWRNSLAGIAYALKPKWLKDPTIKYEDLTLELEQNMLYLQQPDGSYLWERTRKLGPIYFISGYRLRPILDGALENRKRIAEGLERAPRPPLDRVNLDGRPVVTIRTKRTL